MDTLITFGPLILIAVVFYFLVIRPAKARQRKQQETLNSAGPGTDVMLTSGIYGTIVSVDEDSMELSVAPGVVLKVAKAAISKILEPEPISESVPEPGTEA